MWPLFVWNGEYVLWSLGDSFSAWLATLRPKPQPYIDKGEVVQGAILHRAYKALQLQRHDLEIGLAHGLHPVLPGPARLHTSIYKPIQGPSV